MNSKNGYKTENPTVKIIAVFYIIIGCVQIGYFAIENMLAPPHILVLGILSLITAYTILTKKKWTIPFVVGLFFVGITFGITTLFNSISLQNFDVLLLINIAIILYIVILFIASFYIIIKRKSFNQ
jgi:hypothetical protein